MPVVIASEYGIQKFFLISLTVAAALFAVILTGVVAAAPQQATPRNSSASGEMGGMATGGMTGGHMAHMAGHMYMTKPRPLSAADQKRADEVAAKAKIAMAPYMDYHKALNDGYQIFHPDIPQQQYHFTNYENAFAAALHFDPLKPTSLLYKKTPDGGYKLMGAMYTDRVTAPESELNDRIPLSIARWHQHINFCQAPPDQKAAYFGPNAKFGLQGSIINEKDCEAAGGKFRPHLFGWMVHVYPFETDLKKVWSVDDDDEGHDNMDHSTMPGMKMN